MKQLVSIISLVMIMAFTYDNGAAPSTPMNAAALDTVNMVKKIKADFNAIDLKRKSYAQYEPLERTEGVLYTGYYEGQVMKMVNISYYGDTSKTESDMYNNGKGIFFIYSKDFSYVSPISVNPRTAVKEMTENWYYFDSETMIKWVRAGKVIGSGSEEFKMKATWFRGEFAKMRAQFKDFSALRKVK